MGRRKPKPLPCTNPFLEEDGWCNLCNQRHELGTPGKRTTPIIVNGEVFEPKKPVKVVRVPRKTKSDDEGVDDDYLV